jgi:hypothetical protein
MRWVCNCRLSLWLRLDRNGYIFNIIEIDKFISKERLVSQLTRKNMSRVYEALDRTRFSSAAFDIEFPDKGDLHYSVKFHGTNYFFYYSGAGLVQHGPGLNTLHFVEGSISLEKSFAFLPTWAGLIHDELSVVLPGESGADDIFELLKKFSTSQDPGNATARFDYAEVLDLTNKLEELEAKLNELVSKHEITEENLIALREAISNAKEDLPNLPRQVWYRVAASKIATTTKQVITSKEGRAIAYESAKKMLGLD